MPDRDHNFWQRKALMILDISSGRQMSNESRVKKSLVHYGPRTLDLEEKSESTTHLEP